MLLRIVHNDWPLIHITLIKLTITARTNTLPQTLGPELILMRTKPPRYSAPDPLPWRLYDFLLSDALTVPSSAGVTSALRPTFVASMTAVCDRWALS